MKKYLIIALSVVAIGLFAGCNDWLALYPYNAIADDVAITNVSDAQIALKGVYNQLRGVGFYGRSMFVDADAGCEDVVLRTDNSNRFVNQYRWNLLPGDSEAGNLWANGYTAIKYANVIIQRLPDAAVEPGMTQADKDQVMGEALFLRALIHFDLATYFAREYDYAGNGQMGIIYMLEPSMSNDHPRESITETFSLILKDLEDALALMKADYNKPSLPITAGRDAVKALLARVHLYMAGAGAGDHLVQASNYAEELITSGRYPLVSAADYTITFNDNKLSSKAWGPDNLTTNTEFILALPYTTTERNYTDALGKIYLDKQKGYGDLVVSKQFLELFENDPGDVRSTMAYSYADAGGLHDCYGKFFGDGTTNYDLSTIPIFRSAEMYLIAAEGWARRSASNESKARGYLNDLRAKRGASALDDSYTGTSLREEIAKERRRELCIEGHGYIDHKRTHTSIVRTPDPMNTENQNLGLEYGGQSSYKFAYPIPEREFTVNFDPEFKQNEGYSK